MVEQVFLEMEYQEWGLEMARLREGRFQESEVGRAEVEGKVGSSCEFDRQG